MHRRYEHVEPKLGATAQRSFTMPSCKLANLIWDGNAALRNSGGLH